MIYYNGEMTQSYPGDAGFDLYASEDSVVTSFNAIRIPTGVRLELPPDIFAQVVPRSGLSLKGLMVVTGTIDSGYRGEINVIAYSLYDLCKVMRGDKIAQLVFHKKVTSLPVFKENISYDTDRSDKGFGSSGK